MPGMLNGMMGGGFRNPANLPGAQKMAGSMPGLPGLPSSGGPTLPGLPGLPGNKKPN